MKAWSLLSKVTSTLVCFVAVAYADGSPKASPNYKKGLEDYVASQVAKGPTNRSSQYFQAQINNCRLNKSFHYGDVDMSEIDISQIKKIQLSYSNLDYASYWLEISCDSKCIVRNWSGLPTVKVDWEPVRLPNNYEKALKTAKALQELTRLCGGGGAIMEDSVDSDKARARETAKLSNRSDGGYSKLRDAGWVTSGTFQTIIKCDSGRTETINYYNGPNLSDRYGVQGRGSRYYSTFEEAAISACR